MSKTFQLKAIRFSQTVLIQTIQFSASTVLMLEIVLFEVIQFSISTKFSSIWTIDWTLSGVTTPGQSGPGSDGNGGVLRIPQRSSITGTSLSDCLVSYLGHSLEEVLLLCRDAVGVFYRPSRLGHSLRECLTTLQGCSQCFYTPSQLDKHSKVH